MFFPQFQKGYEMFVNRIRDDVLRLARVSGRVVIRVRLISSPERISLKNFQFFSGQRGRKLPLGEHSHRLWWLGLEHVFSNMKNLTMCW